MRKYIHIGYPKNFSTSLQRDYFSAHPDLFHLGIGLENNLGYHDELIEKTFEVYLKTAKSFKYKEVQKEITDHFNSLFNSDEVNKFKSVGISSEHLSFAFTHDGLSAEEKSKRLFDIFGSDTTILLIIRNQFELIKSLYRESVRVGFIGNFNKYIELIYKYQDRNFIYDFRFDLVFKLYADIFGKEKVKVLFFEDYRNDDGALNNSNDQFHLLSDLSKALGVNNYNMEFKHFNKAIPSNKILVKSELNKMARHDLGNHLLESAEKHRIKSYLEDDLNFIEKEEKTFSDVLVKRRLIQESLDSKTTKELTYSADTKIVGELKSFYEKGNRNFESVSGVKLPSKYHSLKF